jgi:hemerythrin-like metal-binding protein
MSHAQPIAHSSDPATDHAKADVRAGGGRADLHLDWMEVLETGIEELDSWHRQLIRQCNDLLSAAHREAHWAMIIEKADALAKNCVEHFRLEEALMHSNDFPRIDAHRDEHRRIAAKLWWLADAIRVSDGTAHRDRALPAEFKAVLLDVMVRHDLDYLSHLHNRLGR